MSRFTALLLASATALVMAADEKKDDPGAPKLTEAESALVEKTNAERRKADRNPLKPNAKLMDAARNHAADMAAQDKLEHVLDEKTPADRVAAAGYKPQLVGENIAWNAKDAAGVVAEWMDSPTHRDNILRAEYTEIGVAVAKNKRGEPYWVQVFGKP
ncbi:CAP domain-containing protein [Gemmata sp. JC673]|uniref:CAP domain-containing protein n=1 Tax=Gemmata algarum TaxID=2975278 RepID=A0ABU5FD53_9BACT|nr:CAP domain-containing protein [Gemmata algarum]MDY3563741.1 CAP domain-containing protein [Gemmata algarum]